MSTIIEMKNLKKITTRKILLQLNNLKFGPKNMLIPTITIVKKKLSVAYFFQIRNTKDNN